MRRLHLIELEDQPWFPTLLRNYGTDFLQFLTNKTGMFKPAVPLIEETLKKSDTATIIDLGSGGGGGLIGINDELKNKIPNLKIILTDNYPNIPAFERAKTSAENIEYYIYSIDARNVPLDLKGLRTMFLVFHHFKPEDAKLILQNAIDSQNPIAIFEGQERSVLSIIAMLFSPITTLLVTPFIRPFTWGRIIFTYLLPVVPLFILWDGVVSSLRTYSIKEMNLLINRLHNWETFEWKVGKLRSGPGNILYLIGTEARKTFS